jgi:hypothetical protein
LAIGEMPSLAELEPVTARFRQAYNATINFTAVNREEIMSSPWAF